MPVTWILSAQTGTLDGSGKYTAPNPIDDSAAVTVIARVGYRTNQATVNLVPNPWTGWRVHALGAYLLAVFLLVFLLIGFWPPALPTPEVAKAERLESEKALKDQTDALKIALVTAESEKDMAKQAQAVADKAPTDAAKSLTASTAAARAQADGDALFLVQIQEWRDIDELDQKREIEETVKKPDVCTLLAPKGISREIDLILLVLLAGALGSFLHAARSFADFLGNQRLKRSWAWWYCLAPFTGAILALVFYAAIRGGFLAINAGSITKASDLNPYGVAGLSFIVGMFSKTATTKLGELFNSFFNTDKAKETKDKLKADSETPGTDAKVAPPANTGTHAPAPKP